MNCTVVSCFCFYLSRGCFLKFCFIFISRDDDIAFDALG